MRSTQGPWLREEPARHVNTEALLAAVGTISVTPSTRQTLGQGVARSAVWRSAPRPQSAQDLPGAEKGWRKTQPHGGGQCLTLPTRRALPSQEPSVCLDLRRHLTTNVKGSENPEVLLEHEERGPHTTAACRHPSAPRLPSSRLLTCRGSRRAHPKPHSALTGCVVVRLF